jgi:hypothetical protein
MKRLTFILFTANGTPIRQDEFAPRRACFLSRLTRFFVGEDDRIEDNVDAVNASEDGEVARERAENAAIVVLGSDSYLPADCCLADELDEGMVETARAMFPNARIWVVSPYWDSCVGGHDTGCELPHHLVAGLLGIQPAFDFLDVALPEGALASED